MPLLFKNGKLVINDIDQLVFSDDPDSCRCCPGLCECPPGSDYSVPKYVEDVSISFANVQDTYSEEIKINEVAQWSDGIVDEFILERSFEISGMSALNGTYPFSLRTLPNLDSDCVQPDPIPPCAFDTNNLCMWVLQNAPTVSVSGTFRNKQFVKRNGIVETDTDDTLYITGYAVGFQNVTTVGLGSTSAIRVFVCLRDGSYSGAVLGSFVLWFNYDWAIGPGFGDLMEVVAFTNTNINYGNRDLNNCTETIFIPPTLGLPFLFRKVFPPSVLPRFVFSSGAQCNTPGFGGGSVNSVWCYDNSLPSTSYTINGCQGSSSFTDSSPPTLNFRGYNRTQTVSYDYAGYAFDSSWNYTLDPP